MPKDLTVSERLALIKRHTEEIISEEELLSLLKEKKKPVVYWGTAITGKPHIGYLLCVLKLVDFIKAGFKVKILLADVHGALDSTPWNILEYRYQYYAEALKGLFYAVGGKLHDFEVIRGSSFQLGKPYISDLLKLATIVSLHDARKAATEVVKQVEGDQSPLAGFLYPLMQALDEEYLGVDIQYGGIDQRKILVFAREYLPKLGYSSRIEVMTPLIPSLTEGGKMSASNLKSKVDLLDPPEEIRKKIMAAYCPEGNPLNSVLAFVKYVIMVLKEEKKEPFIIHRDKKFGGDVAYTYYDFLEQDFIAKKLHPLDLKNAVAQEIIEIVQKIDRKKLEKLAQKAYSSE